jgi:hypothetical protein
MTLSLQDYRNLLIAACLIALLLAALPAASVLVAFRTTRERFSELWLLGPDHMAENYAFNVAVGESGTMYLGIGNHMGSSTYYAVYVKFRNQTQPLPDETTSTPSSRPSLYEIRTFIQDGKTWEKLMTFSILEASQSGNTSFVNRLAIDNRSTSTDSSTSWDPERAGFYYQLFFELWIYDTATKNLTFHNRFVTMWLNMT